jgi:hypothetical protein
MRYDPMQCRVMVTSLVRAGEYDGVSRQAEAAAKAVTDYYDTCLPTEVGADRQNGRGALRRLCRLVFTACLPGCLPVYAMYCPTGDDVRCIE